MSLLGELIDGAGGEEASVPSLLRKLKILASRTSTTSLSDWVGYELNGYPEGADLPEYRGPFEPALLGHFAGAYGREARNLSIPRYIFPDDMQDSPYLKLWLPQAVAQIEELAIAEHVNLAWPGDAVAYFNLQTQRGEISRILEPDMMLMAVNRPVPRHVYKGLLDTVRNRVLDLALSLEEVVPQAGQPGVGDETRRHAQQVIHNHFHGSTGNVAIASHGFTQNHSLPAVGDEAGLMQHLEALGVTASALTELRKAISEDRNEAGAESPGPGRRVVQWMGGLAFGAGTGASGDLIATALKSYFGIAG